LPHTVQVDPTSSTPGAYTTIAAALAALPSTGGIVEVPPLTTITENIAIPNGGEWEIRCDSLFGGVITGNITLDSTAQTVTKLTNLKVSGNVSGEANAVANALYVGNCKITGNVSLTGAGGGFWYSDWQGFGTKNFTGIGGNVSGTAAVFGGIYASNWDFVGAMTYAQLEANNCRLPTSHSINAGSVGVLLESCYFVGATTFTAASGTPPISCDQASMGRLLKAGCTAAGGAVFSSTCGVYKKAVVAYAANVSSTNIISATNNPPGQYRVDFVNEVTAGAAGASVANVIYVGRNGALTQPVTSAIDTGQASGEFTFYHDGSAPIKYSVGSVTPSSLAASLSIALTYLGNDAQL
jgi:hypothetical protein